MKKQILNSKFSSNILLLLAEGGKSKRIASLSFIIGVFVPSFVAYLQIPVTFYSEEILPVLSMETVHQGIGPDRIEDTITKPLEEAISRVGGIEEIFSVSEEGKSRINIKLSHGVDTEIKSMEIRDKTEPIISSFPRDVRKPTLLKYDPNHRPFLILGLDSNKRDEDEIREIAETHLKKAFEKMNGTAEIFVAGGRIREILVDIDRNKLLSRSLTPSQILYAIQNSNRNISAGELPFYNGWQSLRLIGRLEGPDSISSIKISPNSDIAVQINEVANISFSYREKEVNSRIDGQERIVLYVHSSSDASMEELASDTEKLLDSFFSNPAYSDLTYQRIFDESLSYQEKIQELYIRIAVGFISVFILTGFIYRHTSEKKIKFLYHLYLLLTYLFGFLVTALVLYLRNKSFNSQIITGFITGVYLTSFWVFCRCKRKETVVTSSLLLLIGLLLPVLVMESRIGRILADFSISAILFPLFSIVFYYLFIENNHQLISGSYSTLLEKFSGFFSIRFQNLSLKFKQKMKWLMEMRFIPFKLIRRNFIFIKPIFFLILWTSGFFAFYYSTHSEFSFEENALMANVELHSGTSHYFANTKTLEIERLLRNHAAIKEITSKVEGGQGTLTIKLLPTYRPTEELIEEFEKIAGNVEGAFLYFQAQSSSNNIKEIGVDVFGDDLVALDKNVRLLAHLSGKIPQVTGLVLRYKPPRPEIKVKPRNTGDLFSQLYPADIASLLRLGIQGAVSTKFIFENKEMDVRIRYRDEQRANIADIKNYKIMSRDGSMLPLSEVSYFENGEMPVRIYRKNKMRVFSFAVRTSITNYATVKEQLQEILDKTPLPEGFRSSLDEEAEADDKIRKEMLEYFLLAFFFAFGILSADMNSFKKALSYFSILLSSTATSMIFIYLFGIPLSFPTIAGTLIGGTIVFFINLGYQKDTVIIPLLIITIFSLSFTVFGSDMKAILRFPVFSLFVTLFSGLLYIQFQNKRYDI